MDNPDPKPKSSTNYMLFLLGLVLLITLGAIGLAAFGPDPEPSRTPFSYAAPPPAAYRGVIDEGRGRNDRVGHDFKVPAGCTKPILSFSGRVVDKDVDVAFANFRIHDTEITDYAADSSGPHDLDPTGSGSDRLMIEAGHTYYVETSAYNANWSYTIECE